MGSSSLCFIFQIDAICHQEGKCVKLDKSIKSVLCILEFSKVVETNLPSNLKIYLVFKACIQRFARYKIEALILIGRLCNFVYNLSISTTKVHHKTWKLKRRVSILKK